MFCRYLDFNEIFKCGIILEYKFWGKKYVKLKYKYYLCNFFFI